ncbi:NAD kinase 2, mitochondrial isoform X1 [Zootermopsis nevadensis]|uniref:NAD kinase 2, mitochondrial isoform X1 n=1 Tax=Zootermopsis nevadensis TaxID=136037 RepID=UPI000B8E6C9E|nr:NAD kinase 2, mitochondrial isoform X1 [Zootermopsis nevadensis]
MICLTSRRSLGKRRSTWPLCASIMSGQRHYSAIPSICLKRALLVSKVTRYELECKRYPDLKMAKLEATLRKQCFDYDVLLQHHNLHKEFEHRVRNIFNECGIETRIVNRSEYTQSNIDWADIIIPTGGDGTYLMAASRVSGNEKPVVGLNSDPSRSEGYLCLPVKYSENVKEAVDKLLKGEFEWMFRSRIRITLHGENLCATPFELHEHVIHPSYSELERKKQSLPLSSMNVTSEVLPVLALNEVYMGESLSSRVSYFGLSLDNGAWTKVKSSGLCVSTGTGSTSWHISINRITEQSVAEVLKLLGMSHRDPGLVKQVTDEFNQNLVFNCEDKRMTYTVRDLISAGVWPDPKGLEPRGFANKIEVKSRCFDGGLVIDGGVFFRFNEGTTATLEIHKSDALRTVRLTEK